MKRNMRVFWKIPSVRYGSIAVIQPLRVRASLNVCSTPGAPPTCFYLVPSRTITYYSGQTVRYKKNRNEAPYLNSCLLSAYWSDHEWHSLNHIQISVLISIWYQQRIIDISGYVHLCFGEMQLQYRICLSVFF